MLERIEIPDLRWPLEQHVELIEEGNRRADLFTEKRKSTKRDTIHNFVVCDFGMVGATIDFIARNHLASGDTFCEWGSGMGVVTMMAQMAGFRASGIEVEGELVQQSLGLAADFGIDATFFEGSFLPDEIDEARSNGLSEDPYWESITDVDNVDLDAPSAYPDLGQSMDDFDLVFAFPWPGEHFFFEEIFDRYAAHGALLLTYDGRNGLNLQRRL
ncbi:hypothetical protein Q31b_53540 [Novipirellula aureliae]|uniref:Uncharacterized protein n=1 Tax=Novipirellula aureliae TaxID=2527966 RepID=A0A5C6DEY7_9BACT|nr:hypothetical protein [Novipirellula aureliae]TWU35258.1 hypothetical protein Q31b_53540 [Novipirellula aureliae]